MSIDVGLGPTFLVIGAARSGTTGLIEGLRGHPQVFVTSPKEPHYFAFHGQTVDFQGPGDAHTINAVSISDESEYRALYPKNHEYHALGDGSVSSLYYFQRAIPEALRFNPRMRFVVLLREPVSRAFSSHQYLRSRGFETVENFLDAVELEESRKSANWHHLWHYTSMSLYSEALAAIQDMVPSHQLGVWFHDDLERDYVGTVKEVLRFLEVPEIPGEVTDRPRVNISGEPRLKHVQQAIAWATRHERLRAGVKRLTSYRFRERIRRGSLRRSDIPAQLHERLAPRFVDDLRRLDGLLSDSVKRPGWLVDATGRPE